MFKKQLKLKADVIRWHQFTHHGDAVFLSLRREIVISTLSVATLLATTPSTAHAQTAAPMMGDDTRSMETDEVTVTASRLPLSMEQTARIVSVMTREQIKDCPAQSVNDLLKYAAAVDVRQRGAFGIQTDVCINGGTHDQIVILLNGVNISSPQTGHLAVDIPVSVDDIERIEILEGAASRVYGTSAFSGAINIVTKGRNDNDSETVVGTVALSGGSFGTFGADASVGVNNKKIWNRISGGYQQSDGGTENSDFKNWRGFYQAKAELDDVNIDWQLGLSGKNYGANTFYSGKYPNQYEENRRYTASVSAQTKGRVIFSPTLYWNCSFDHYQLIKNAPTGENFHRTDVYGASMNARFDWLFGVSSIGADFRNEGILSTALGKPLDENLYVNIPGHDGQYKKRDNRTNVCYFLEHDVLLRRWTISAGLMANMNTGLDQRYRLYPGVDISYRPSSSWKLYASWNMAQRMPTFTDLYYKSPTQEGNTGLIPEKTSEFTVGTTYRTSGLKANLRMFHRHQMSMIDWVMTLADSVNGYTTYHATNFKVDVIGYDINATVLFTELMNADSPLRTFQIDYSYLNQKRHDDVEIYASSYALDYLRHKIVMRLDARFIQKLFATLTYRWQDRMGSYVKYTPEIVDGKTSYGARTVSYNPFGLLDLRLQWKDKQYEVYLEGNNLTNYRYYDLGNVEQPGFWLMAGAKWIF